VKEVLYYVTSVVGIQGFCLRLYEVFGILFCMGTAISRRMDDSDSQSRSDDSSDQEYALTTILQYLIRRLVWGLTFHTLTSSCNYLKVGSTAA
jgi:hypothetical protein